MARVLGVDIPENKRIEVALTYVRGIGLKKSNEILEATKIDPDIRAKDLSDAQIASIRAHVEKLALPIEGELRRIVTQNIRRLQEIRSYRGERHKKGLPARGQRTSTNARTRKGKRKTVGGTQKKLTKK
ncbi:30S ribosomal protein S13 [Candidatus Nomurabacteria bacterium]|uniref:Small ribosomal subunit protein uS13 n=1 Tax=candidate division WWE3 bacterium TaxID=2053526 RepID=A0A955DZV1_UNCKA|nr:30S ribosomal protein S13 [candidate division WWE3 bacterium]MCB9823759.1 30S ribosomal protein S13 [Candidatus Nomurabacteria bacterium]MCB9826835.1 30S ribosomal protein S13 [Candidatus Nomurabacteria bacterium]MCB9827554.1 30S ribosomal protein S13 [Candidatus Nomurabacteria bacterium]HXK52421.1 30S ribosomal protein S13 [bacterium]